jgi:hypothetical protein
MSNVTLFSARGFESSRAAGRILFVRQRCVAGLLASGMVLTSLTHAFGREICKPTLTFNEAHLSEMRPPTLERRWTATVTAEASRCGTTAGYFEVGISRLKEDGIEFEFREQFIWSSPSVTVGIDFWADEAVESYWIDSVQSCPCARNEK